MILITHELLDVFTLADRVLVLESGKVAEIGPVADVLTAPRSHFGARIAGVNLVNGAIGPDGALHGRSGLHLHGTLADGVRRQGAHTGTRQSRCSRPRPWPSTETSRTAARAIPSR